MIDVHNITGAQLKAWRRDYMKITQLDLAEAIGIGVTYLKTQEKAPLVSILIARACRDFEAEKSVWQCIENAHAAVARLESLYGTEFGPRAGEPGLVAEPTPAIIVHIIAVSWPDLTNRQCQVLAQLSHGKNNREIGEALGIGENTVNKHVKAMMHKMGVPNRTTAALRADRVLRSDSSSPF